VLVGTSVTDEGSYGLESANVERPEDSSVASACQVPQDLLFRCD